MQRAAPLLLTLAACHPAPAHDLPICPVLVTAARATEADSRVLPPDLWFALLAPGFERSTGTPARDPRDCSQRPLLASDEPALATRARTPDDLSFGTSSDGALLVWARLFDYPDGSARGPVVLARWVAQGLEIRGVGSLRAPARRVRLHLERLADGHPLLIAEGESCPPPTTWPSGQATPCAREGESCPLPTTWPSGQATPCAREGESCPLPTTWPSGQATPCAREAVLLPLVDQRFLAADIIEGREPPRPARLRLDDRRELPRPGGGVRRIEVRRRIDLRGAPTLHAAIRIRDCSPGAACDDHLTLVDARPLELAGLTFVTAEDPWQQLLAQQTTR